MSTPTDSADRVPGSVVPGGRYRLLERLTGPDGVEFWRAHDTVMNRAVALTRIDLSAASTTGREQSLDHSQRLQMVARATGRSVVAGPEHPVARIFDVLDLPGEAIVVAEWLPGHSLADVAAPDTAAAAISRSIEPLATAAEIAADRGDTLGIDHPHRIRIGSDGLARLAFPGILPASIDDGGARGIASVIYTLATGAWPETADCPPLRSLRPDMPDSFTAATDSALTPRGEIGELAGFIRLDQTDHPCGDPAPDRTETTPKRLPNKMTAAILSATAVVVVATWLPTSLGGRIADSNSSQAIPEAGVGSSHQPKWATAAAPAAWATATYRDQLPAPRNGVGLIVTLTIVITSPVKTSELLIWITRLARVAAGYQADLSSITVAE